MLAGCSAGSAARRHRLLFSLLLRTSSCMLPATARRPPEHSRHRLHHAWSAGPTHAEHLLVPQYPETPQQVRSPPEEVPPPLGTLLCLRSAADPQRPAYSLLAPVLYQAALCHLRTQALHAGRPGSAIDRLPSAGCRSRRWSSSATPPSRPSRCVGPAPPALAVGSAAQPRAGCLAGKQGQRPKVRSLYGQLNAQGFPPGVFPAGSG